MSILFCIAKTKLFTNDIQEIIKAQLQKHIKDCYDWNEFTLGINFADEDISQLKFEGIVEGKNVWENIAKLSRDLKTDYEYYRHFSFKSQYNTEIYKDRLIYLGFQCTDGVWMHVNKPNETEILLNIFMHRLYQSLVDKMDTNLIEENEHLNMIKADRYLPLMNVANVGVALIENKDTSTNIPRRQSTDSIICPYCDNESTGDKEICDVCKGNLSDINNIQINPLPMTSEEVNDNRGPRREDTVSGDASTRTKPDLSDHKESSKEGWICSRCACTNNDGNTHCNHCLRQRDTVLSDGGRSDQRRVRESHNSDIIRSRQTSTIDDNGGRNERIISDKEENGNTSKKVTSTQPLANTDRSFEGRRIDSDESTITDRSQLPNNTWTCSSCTFANQLISDTCEVCMNSKKRLCEGDKVEEGYSEENKHNTKAIKLQSDGNQIIAELKSFRNTEKEKGRIDGNKFNNSHRSLSSDYAPSRDIVNNSYYDRIKTVISKDANERGLLPDTWVCSVCTCINSLASRQCKACDRDRYNANINANETKTDSISEIVKSGEKKNNKTITNPIINKDRGYTIKSGPYPYIRPVNPDIEDKKVIDDKTIGDTVTIINNIIDDGAQESQTQHWLCPSRMDPSNEVTDDSGDVTEVSTETWKCKHCRCDNLFDKFICGKCHKYAPFFRKWVCERCSFFNDELAPQCAVCNNKNVNVVKCTKCQSNKINITFGRECDACIAKAADAVTDIPSDEWIQVTDKKCATCKNKIKSTEGIICKRCSSKTYYCNNRRCGANNDNKYDHCRQCQLKKGCNITEYNLADVHNGKIYMKMWQCTFCGLFNQGYKCNKCKNMRRSETLLPKCICNWINKRNANKCDKCHIILKKSFDN